MGLETGRTASSLLQRRLSHNAVTLLVSNAGSAALSFLLSVLIGRALGQDGLGIYAAALAWVFPLSLAADFGIATLITRDLAQQPQLEPRYLQSAVWARLLLGGGLTLALVAAAPFLSDHPAVVRGLQLAAPLVVIGPFLSTFTAVFRAQQVMWPIPWLNIGMLAAQVIITALIFATGGGVLTALAANTLTSAGQLAVAWWVWRRWFSLTLRLPLPQGEEEAVRTFRLLRRAWPFALAAVLAALQLRLNTVLLERLSTTAEVGYYAAAARFVEAGRVLPNAVFGALLPALTVLALDPAGLAQTFRRVMLGLAAFGAALGGLFAIFGAAVVRLTYGAAFADSVPALHIAMWSLLPGLLRGGQTLYWFAIGREQYANRVNALALALQAALGLWLIPRHGAVGAAGAGLIVEVAALALLSVGRRELR